jgi:iron(III) transport system permease protein
LTPLAAPAYLVGYAYTSFLDYYGPVQSLLREIFQWQSVEDYWFPDIRNLWGALGMFIVTLYPYVYLLARSAFKDQGVVALEASRSLGCSPWQSFWRVALPLARPAIAAGLALAMMETLNDFGTVQYFGVNTFTTGIYITWFGMGERQGAAQLAAGLMVFILALVFLELYARHQSRYYQNPRPSQFVNRYPLRGWRGILAALACFLPLLFGFLIPLLYLLYLTLAYAQEVENNNFLTLAQNSLLLASLSALLAVVLAVFLAYGKRLLSQPLLTALTRLAASGYALPGSVIAVGILIPAGQFDNALDQWMRAQFQISTGLLLSGTLILLVYAYLVRFLAVAFGAVDSSLLKIKPSLDDAARSLGRSPLAVLGRVHLPLLTGGLLTAAMLVFVDVMKELPATLVIRPFNFDTLAVRVYQYASDERLTEAAAPALAIMGVGLLPVILLSLRLSRHRVSHPESLG